MRVSFAPAPVAAAAGGALPTRVSFELTGLAAGVLSMIVAPSGSFAPSPGFDPCTVGADWRPGCEGTVVPCGGGVAPWFEGVAAPGCGWRNCCIGVVAKGDGG